MSEININKFNIQVTFVDFFFVVEVWTSDLAWIVPTSWAKLTRICHFCELHIH